MAQHLTTTTSKPLPSLSFLFSFIISHPLYFSYLIFFSPYLLKLIFFISPLFFTTSLLILLSIIASSIPHSKLGFVQSLIDKISSKLNNIDHDYNDLLHDFEDFELYKIVFHDPPLLLKVADPDDNAVNESEQQTSLEKLFEELDRFEGSTMADEMKEIQTRSLDEEVELYNLEPVTSPNSDENSFLVNSDSCISESSRSFGSCGSVEDETTTFEMKENETRSYVEKVVGELQKSQLVKSNLSVAVEKKNIKTTSHVQNVLQKLEPMKVSVSGEDQKTVKSNSTAEIEKRKSSETTSSHVQNVLKKLEPVPISTVKSKTTVVIETKKNIETASDERKISQKVKANPTAEIEMKKVLQKSMSVEDEKTVQSSFSQSNSWRSDSSSSFGSYGSMRKEKEWKRTLACKLFEERNSSCGEEGMDSLWEAYEDDNNRKARNKKESMSHQNNKKKLKNNNKSELFKYFEDVEDEEEEDDEEEFMSNGQLCCLKALKLSTGKMNLGMGKPNLVKISKVFKGFGWLHHVGGKNGKKN